MQKYKLKTFESLDSFFEEVKKRIVARCEALKEEYKQIESREKRRLKNR